LVIDNSQKNIGNGKLGEGILYFPLPRAPFRMEEDVSDTVESVNIPFGKGVRSADYSVARRI